MESGIVPQIGDTVNCWRESQKQYVPCKILLDRTEPNGSKKYFVHFIDVNKRWDDWVFESALDLLTLEHKTGTKGRKVSSHTQEEDAEADLSYFGKSRNIEYLRFSRFLMKAWYFSPVPDPFDKMAALIRGDKIDPKDNGILYCCEFCMRFFATDEEYTDHCRKCTTTHPPGDEIYRNGRISAYEVDGAFASRYCVNLCLITKLFLFHKAEYYAPQEFHFYIVCTNDVRGSHPIGFFSKEKKSEHGFNLACILTFPCYQRMGIGSFLISLSYEFSKIEKKPGSPETPLSDLGFLTYRKFWRDAVIGCLVEHRNEQLSITSISNYTGMTLEDVKFAVRDNKFIRNYEGEWVFALTHKQIDEWRSRSRRRLLRLDPRRLRWTPYLKAIKKGE
ncbi:histone acetyltransferase of the MYST family 1 [Histomonas meleagridis]|uniref:histone acetyltransferase of the MYST family 1 n=1 Tax=Histomonas meleagridis TaxID=135588 RepID=UPI0035599699|nr:histone acetyltransferase of the MYST family 1 [Histomonas meleagridis]KAH0805624.1 histone acetyltransferase of the MYST family 1 [Histomonas meleagridis]